MNRRHLLKLLFAAPLAALAKPLLPKPIQQFGFGWTVRDMGAVDLTAPGEWVLNPEWSRAGQHRETIWLSGEHSPVIHSGPPPKDA